MQRSPIHTRICDMLGVEHPIFAFSHSKDVVVAVCLAGGVGVLGATRMFPDEIEATLAEIRERVGPRPFGVDLVLPQGMPERNNREEIDAQLPEPHRAFVDHLYEKYHVPRDGQAGPRSRFVRSNEVARRQADVVLDSDVDIFAMGIGSPPEFIAAAKDAGKRVMALVGNPKHARKALAQGAEILVAQGHDSGAHTGPIGTFSLVPQITAMAGDVPVLAAGGVATGQHIVAAMAMGAVGVWVGTAWLVTKEGHTSAKLMPKLLAANSDDTVITRSKSGKTNRQLRTAYTDEWEAADAPEPLKMPYQDILVGDLLGAIDRYEVEPLLGSGLGQGIAWFKVETTVAEVMEKFVAEARLSLDLLDTLRAASSEVPAAR
ncbi:nitronate monooxygenase [Candidatus Amarobacter glycogenicus]|uniref:NAD(P)H-dependent flavin oxidoreductase n=1 Tax=Candidatus Amarobacter glycogenicus TaxID=3140699 RepID=UPI0031371BF4|nr:nitronate monooxygenase [Dehalococcoidia bacterium]